MAIIISRKLKKKGRKYNHRTQPRREQCEYNQNKMKAEY